MVVGHKLTELSTVAIVVTDSLFGFGASMAAGAAAAAERGLLRLLQRLDAEKETKPDAVEPGANESKDEGAKDDKEKELRRYLATELQAWQRVSPEVTRILLNLSCLASSFIILHWVTCSLICPFSRSLEECGPSQKVHRALSLCATSDAICKSCLQGLAPERFGHSPP